MVLVWLYLKWTKLIGAFRVVWSLNIWLYYYMCIVLLSQTQGWSQDFDWKEGSNFELTNFDDSRLRNILKLKTKLVLTKNKG